MRCFVAYVALAGAVGYWFVAVVFRVLYVSGKLSMADQAFANGYGAVNIIVVIDFLVTL